MKIRNPVTILAEKMTQKIISLEDINDRQLKLLKTISPITQDFIFRGDIRVFVKREMLGDYEWDSGSLKYHSFGLESDLRELSFKGYLQTTFMRNEYGFIHKAHRISRLGEARLKND